jgi:hypothetical protein
MPYNIVYRKGEERPWKIVEKDTGKVVGSSKSEKDARVSAWKRMGGDKK